MDWILYFVDLIRHLDIHLNDLVGTMGPWFYLAMFAIIFCETGLVITPFLPGDSLLFTLGAMCMSTNSELNLPTMGLTLLAGAVLGDAINYSLGYWTGPRVFKSEKSFLLNKDHLLKAQQFYEKYGKKMIILARFVPIIRTFAPFVAGIGKMTYPIFLAYNVIGAIAWVGICMGAGVLFGQIPWVKENFEVVIVGVIFISILPLVYEYLLSRSAAQKKTTTDAPDMNALTSEFKSKAG
ncbi:MAG: DedA family protein [Planctomycetes bacterium]|nr:DedA family protein [Planctomycetota bacterium]NBY03528.1 DedA family protein [Planctomycetota bacterium]